MKKILKVLLVVLFAIVAFKFVTSSFFIWMLAAAALPQLVKFVFTKYGDGKIWLHRLHANRYLYSFFVMAAIPLLGLKIGLVIAAAIGIGISYLMFEDIKKQ